MRSVLKRLCNSQTAGPCRYSRKKPKPYDGARAKAGRKPSSARFATCYKEQVFNDRNACWDDIQRAHGSAEAARAAYPPGRRCRVTEVTPQGRQPLE